MLSLFLLAVSSVAMIPPNRTEFIGRPVSVIPTVAIGRGVSSWPAKTFAPYIYLSQYSPFDYNSCTQSTGTKYYSLAFITADQNGNPAWNGYDSLSSPFYSNYIGGIRANGGDVIPSFGGAGSTEIAQITYDVNSLAQKYQSVIDAYSLTYIDIDIEGPAGSDTGSIDRRSQAVAILLRNNPNLRISLTIATGTNGLDGNGMYIINSAVKYGAQVSRINIMAMDYGDYIADMGAVAISAAAGTYSQIQNAGLNAKVGVTAMIGVNDVVSEVFQLSHAAALTNWASQQSYVDMLGFWSMSRDSSNYVNNGVGDSSSGVYQPMYGFSAIFNKFSAGSLIANWNTCPSVGSTSICADGYSCCYGTASDSANSKGTCRPSAQCYTAPALIANWNACPTAGSTSICANGYSCCFGSASDAAGSLSSCRPAAQCFTPPALIANWNACPTAGSTSICANGYSCCYGSASDAAGSLSSCRPAAQCFTPPPLIANFNSCPTAGSNSICANGFTCCVGSASDAANNANTCRPSSNCYTTPKSNPVPYLADPNYQGGYSWSNRVFAPYVDISSNYDIAALSNRIGTARYILGFIQTNTKGTPAWAGVDSISGLKYLSQIQSIRLFGGDVLISFGGPSGTELANVASSVKQLVGNYQNVIDGYTVSWLDMNLNAATTSNNTATDIRNQALRALQKSNPNIRVSYSLAITPTGFSADSLYVLQSAITYGVRVDVINIQAYNYGASVAPNAGSASGTYALQSAAFAYSQIQNIGLTGKVGVTVMIGQSDIQTEYFKPADATQVIAWAKTVPWVSLLSFMTINRDDVGLSGISQTKDAFAKLFLQYEN